MKTPRICRTTFILFFLLYALSPLTYDLSAPSLATGAQRGDPGRSLRNVSLYLIEALYEIFVPPSEPLDESSPNRVLIRKKSAVSRGRFDPVPQTCLSAVFAAATLTGPLHFSPGSQHYAVVPRWCDKSSACLPVSSGLSPPLFA